MKAGVGGRANESGDEEKEGEGGRNGRRQERLQKACREMVWPSYLFVTVSLINSRVRTKGRV